MKETEKMIKERLKEAKQKMEVWEITVQEYNRYVKICRKILYTLEKKWKNLQQ